MLFRPGCSGLLPFSEEVWFFLCRVGKALFEK